MLFSYYLLSWNISSPEISPLRDTPGSPGTPPSRANFQPRVYKLRQTLLEYLYRFHKSPNSRKAVGDSRRSLRDILGDIIGDNLREVSENLQTSGDLWKRSRNTCEYSGKVGHYRIISVFVFRTFGFSGRPVFGKPPPSPCPGLSGISKPPPSLFSGRPK